MVILKRQWRHRRGFISHPRIDLQACKILLLLLRHFRMWRTSLPFFLSACRVGHLYEALLALTLYHSAAAFLCLAMHAHSLTTHNRQHCDLSLSSKMAVMAAATSQLILSIPVIITLCCIFYAMYAWHCIMGLCDNGLTTLLVV